VAGAAEKTDWDTIMRVECGIAVVLSPVDAVMRSLMGWKVGKMSRFEVEKFPRMEVEEVGVGVSWGNGLRPGPPTPPREDPLWALSVPMGKRPSPPVPVVSCELPAPSEVAGAAEKTDWDTIMRVECGIAVVLSPVDAVMRWLMGWKVGKMSRFEVEKFPRMEVEEVGVGVSWGNGLRPGCDCCNPIQNMLPRAICGWRGAESKVFASDVISMGGRGIFWVPPVTPKTASGVSGSVFPMFMSGTPNRDISLAPTGGGGPWFIIGCCDMGFGRNPPSREPGKKSLVPPPKF
jgi:hypothetical protein